MKFENLEKNKFHSSSSQICKFNLDTSQTLGPDANQSFSNTTKNNFLKKISQLKEEEVKFNYNFLRKLFICIDYINTIFSLFTIVILYYEHFLYIQNDFKLLSRNNLFRIISLCLSVLSCLLLSVKYINKPFFKNLKYVLKLRDKEFKNKFPYKQFISECLIYLLQPYPNLSYEMDFIVHHKLIIYNINSVLYSFCLLKFYSVLKLVKKWIHFSNQRTRRIRILFTIDSKMGFMYKGLIKGELFLTLMVLINVFLFISAFLFKMFEDYSGKNNPFSNIYNCIWYLIVTMNTSNMKIILAGYGEFVPITFIGRLICVFVCIMGIFILSLLVSYLAIHTELIGGEQSVYYEIERLQIRKKLMKNYFKTHMEFLIAKYKKRSSFDLMILQNKIKILKNTNWEEIKSINKRRNSLIEFIIDSQDICEELEFNETIKKKIVLNCLKENIENIKLKNNFFVESIIYSKNKSYQMYNLCNFVAMSGNIFKFESINEILSKKILKNEDVSMKMRELYFKIKFADTIYNNSNKKLSNISLRQKSFNYYSPSSEQNKKDSKDS